MKTASCAKDPDAGTTILTGTLEFMELIVSRSCERIANVKVSYRETPSDDWINAVEVLQCPDPENTVRRVIREK